MATIPSPLSVERWSLHKILAAIGQPPLRFALRDGEGVSPAGALPVATIVIRDRPTLHGMMHDSEIGFSDGYAEGAIEVEGDLVCALEAAYRSISEMSAMAGVLALRHAGWIV
jgi:cyclopropane-fatty-acyl-phospholipid synthase